MKGEHIVLTKLIGSIYRSTQVYTNEVLEQYDLGSGTYPYLLSLYNNEGINQNQISKELDVDKAMSARVIKRLIDIGYVKKEADQADSRAYKLYLTDKGKSIIPEVKAALYHWNDVITKSLSDEQKMELDHLLSIVLSDTKKYRKSMKVEG